MFIQRALSSDPEPCCADPCFLNTNLKPQASLQVKGKIIWCVGLPDEVKVDSNGQLTSPGQLVGIIQQPCQVLTTQHSPRVALSN